MDSLRNGRILLLNHNKHRHIFSIQPDVSGRVAYLLAHISHDLFDIDVSGGCDFSQSSYYRSFTSGFASRFSVRILSETGI